TNNTLKSYNRRIGGKFENIHPNLYHFLVVIKEESKYFSQFLNNIRKESEPYHNYNDLLITIIPDDYEKF
ncbi:hypothetical protein MXB_3689, partial [Myxobolus squamalis]